MTDWAAFAGFVGVVLALLLFLAHATQRAMTGGAEADGHAGAESIEHPGADSIEHADAESDASASSDSNRAVDAAGVDELGEVDAAVIDDSGEVDAAVIDDSGEVDAAVIDDPVEVDAAVIDDPVEVDAAGGSSARSPRDLPRDGPGLDDLSTAGLLVNVAASQGVFLGLLAVAVWYAGVPPSALGLAPGAEVPALSTSTATATSPLTAATSLDLAPALAVGAAFGVGLYALNEVGAAAGERLGLGSSEELRESLAPDSPGGWVVLLGVVLPIIAGFEELLFRGALVGALTVGAVQAGLDLGAATPWLFAVGSSMAFALGHGAQGRGGVVVTGLLGLTLAGAFVLTWSLPLVFVAHYLINALEFVVHEFLGVDWI